MSEALALVALGATLAAAVARPRWAPDWAVAVLATSVVLALASFTLPGAVRALKALGPTGGFLAALRLLADGARRAGVFDALGALMSRGARGDPRRLLGMVFLVASLTTAALSLDSTIVLLTPIVFATAARLRANPTPQVYACSHLANSASLLLPVSNLTNLLALAATGLAFPRFAALMVLPWLTAIGIEWIVLSRAFAGELRRPPRRAPDTTAVPLPRLALAILALTLAGFAASSALGVAPVWFAVAGAAALTLRVPPGSPRELAGAARPGFLAFVLALGILVAAAGQGGLSSLVGSLLPGGTGLPALLAVAGISAVAANLLNNLPATLIILPVLSAAGPVPVLAMLIGVGVGPNLTYVGSLATLLWRRILHEHAETVELSQFLRLGVLTVPVSLALSTVALWAAAQVI